MRANKAPPLGVPCFPGLRPQLFLWVATSSSRRTWWSKFSRRSFRDGPGPSFCGWPRGGYGSRSVDPGGPGPLGSSQLRYAEARVSLTSRFSRATIRLLLRNSQQARDATSPSSRRHEPISIFDYSEAKRSQILRKGPSAWGAGVYESSGHGGCASGRGPRDGASTGHGQDQSRGRI